MNLTKGIKVTLDTSNVGIINKEMSDIAKDSLTGVNNIVSPDLTNVATIAEQALANTEHYANLAESAKDLASTSNALGNITTY